MYVFFALFQYDVDHFGFRRAKVLLFFEPNRAKRNLFVPNAILCQFLPKFGAFRNKYFRIWKFLRTFADVLNSSMEQLKQIVIQRLGRTLESPQDFEYLSEQIQSITGEYLSPTTLKRLFGHIPYDGQPRPATLSILARYAGYNGWQDYMDKQHIESGFVTAKRVASSELNKGQKLSIAWNPDRECLLEYIGENRFVVLHSHNSKLQIGDRFTATQFIVGQPLTATEVVVLRNAENTLDTYIAGSKSGLTKIELLNV